MGLAEEEGLIRDDSGLLLEDSGVRSTPRKHQYCNKLTNTLILASAFFALGLCVAIPGPTLLDLGDQVNETTSKMMIVFAARSLGYLCGALIGGLLFDCFDRQLLLFTTLLLSAVAMAAIPWSLTLGVMATMFSLQGVSMGVLDTGGNVFCIQLWGKQNGPYIQTLHFAFGIGAFIAPLLAKPFLSPDPTKGIFPNSTELSILHGSVPVSTNLHHQIQEMIYHNRSHRAKKWLEEGGMYGLDESYWNNVNDALAFREKRSVVKESESLIFKRHLDRFKQEINKLMDLRYSQRLRRAPDEKDNQSDFWKWKRNNSRRLVRQAKVEDVHDSVSPSLKSIEGNGKSNSMVNTTYNVTDLDNTGDQNETSVKPANASEASVPLAANATTTAVGATLSTTVVPQTSTQIVSPSIPTEKRPLKPNAATDNGRNTQTADGLNKNIIDNHMKTAEDAAKGNQPNVDQKPALDGAIANQNGSVSNNTTLAPSVSSNISNSSKMAIANMTTLSLSPLPGNLLPNTTVTTPSEAQVIATAGPSPVQPSTSAETKATQAATTTVTSTTTTTKTTHASTTHKPTTTPSPPPTVNPTTTTTSTTTTTIATTTTATTTSTTTQQPTIITKAGILVTASKTNLDVNKGGNKNTGADNSDQKIATTIPITTLYLDITQSTEKFTKPITAVDNFNQVVKNLSRIQIAYVIVGMLLFLNAVLVLVMYCRRKGLLADMGNEEYLHPPVVKMCYKASLLLLLGVFFFIYVGLEVSYGALVTTFAVDYNNWPKEQGATVAAIFWGSLATGRGFSIFIAQCCGPSIMLVIDLVFMLIGSSILSFALGVHDKILWLGTLILGLGMSSVFPAGISWAEKYIPLSGKSTAVFVIGSAMGQMVIPSFIGFLFEKLGNMILMRSTFALSLLLIMLYAFVLFVAKRVSGNASSVNRNGFMPLESDDIDDENLEMDLVHYERSATRKRKQVKLDGNDAQYHVLVSDLEDD